MSSIPVDDIDDLLDPDASPRQVDFISDLLRSDDSSTDDDDSSLPPNFERPRPSPRPLRESSVTDLLYEALNYLSSDRGLSRLADNRSDVQIINNETIQYEMIDVTNDLVEINIDDSDETDNAGSAELKNDVIDHSNSNDCSANHLDVSNDERDDSSNGTASLDEPPPAEHPKKHSTYKLKQ